MFPGNTGKDGPERVKLMDPDAGPALATHLCSEPIPETVEESVVATEIVNEELESIEGESPGQSPRACSPSASVPLSVSLSVSSSFSLCSSLSASESVSQSAISSDGTPAPSSSSPLSSCPSSSSSFTVRDDNTWEAPKGIATQASELTRMLKGLDNAGQPDTPTNPDHGSPTRPTTKPLKSCLKKTSSVGPDAVRDSSTAKKRVRFDTINNRMNVEDGAIRLEVITYIPTPEASPVKESPGIKKSSSPWRGGRAAARRSLEETLSDPSIIAEFQDLDGLAMDDFINYELDVRHLINFFGQGPGGC